MCLCADRAGEVAWNHVCLSLQTFAFLLVICLQKCYAKHPHIRNAFLLRQQEIFFFYLNTWTILSINKNSIAFSVFIVMANGYSASCIFLFQMKSWEICYGPQSYNFTFPLEFSIKISGCMVCRCVRIYRENTLKQ